MSPYFCTFLINLQEILTFQCPILGLLRNPLSPPNSLRLLNLQNPSKFLHNHETVGKLAIQEDWEHLNKQIARKYDEKTNLVAFLRNLYLRTRIIRRTKGSEPFGIENERNEGNVDRSNSTEPPFESRIPIELLSALSEQFMPSYGPVSQISSCLLSLPSGARAR